MGGSRLSPGTPKNGEGLIAACGCPTLALRPIKDQPLKIARIESFIRHRHSKDLLFCRVETYTASMAGARATSPPAKETVSADASRRGAAR